MRPYSADLSLISLTEFRELTAGRQMLPGRMMLQEQMHERFSALKEAGIHNLADLRAKLASKEKISKISVITGLSAEYLVLLKREAGTYVSRPHPLSDFPGIPFEYTELLKSRGIKNTRDLFEQLQTEKQRLEFSDSSGIPVYRVEELFSLCDLSRITGVGGIFARILYETGVRTTGDYARADPSVLLENCRPVIKKYGYPVVNLGLKDIQYGLHYARALVRFESKSLT